MRILIAEDNPAFRRILENMVGKWGFQPVVVADGMQAWDVLQQEDAPRLAILDWMMPGLTGVEVCRRVRERSREPYVYILLLTAKSSQAELVEGMDAGADDYLIKPVESHELRVRLRAGRRIVDLQAELVQAREALRQQALHDGLTGIWNRGAICDFLKRELVRARRESTSVSVVMIDLDHFKLINDRWGHPAGDLVLKEATRRMNRVVRAYDAVGRYGGEEFLIVLPNTESSGAAAEAERIRAAIADEPFVLGLASIDVTSSLGVCSTHAEEGLSPEGLLWEADAALYVAKAGGRNRVEVASEQPALV